MESYSIKNLFNAKEEGIKLLKKYLETKDNKYLHKAMEIDNTNSETLYYYLNDIKTDTSSYNKYLSLYSPFINKECCEKLKIEYMDHKNDIKNVLNSIKDIDINKLDISSLKNALEKYITRTFVKNFSTDENNKVNNIPLDINNEDMFYLSIRLKLGEKLYPIIDFKIDEKDEYKNYKIKKRRECLSYIKVLNEIFIYYLDKEDKDTLYKLINIIDFNEGTTNMAISRVSYYLDQIGEDKKEISCKTGYNMENSIYSFFKNRVYLDSYKELYFDLIENILESKCIKEVIANLKTYYKDNEDIIQIDDNFIKYIKKNTIFTEFYDPYLFGITNARELKTLINIEYRSSSFEYELELLFNFCICIMAGIYEYIGHLLKDYYYYSANFIISHHSSKKEKSEEEDEEEEDEEEQFIGKLLFNNTREIYLCDVLHILDIKNWEKSQEEFMEFFKSEKRIKLIKKSRKKKNYNLSEDCLKILNYFNIQKDELYFTKTYIKMKCRKKGTYIPYKLSTDGCGTHRNYNLFENY